MKVTTFATLINSKIVVPSTTTPYFAVDKHFLSSALAPLVRSIYFDEAWYVSKYPDIGDAISRGLVPNARAHYVQFGYWENRMPYAIDVDEPWYVAAYPDVAQAIQRVQFESGQEHFETVGFQEGRFPFSGFEIKRVS